MCMRFDAAVIVPDFEALGNWAVSQGLQTDDRAALLAHSRTRELFETELENSDLVDIFFDNAGTIDVQSGTVNFTGGGNGLPP